MQLLDTTRQYQSDLAGYCRTGKLPVIPGIKPDNITHYRRLVYNVVDDMLQNAYPLTHALLTAREWKNAVDDFFSSHACQSPQVWYMPKEFHQYLAASGHALLRKHPFLEELLLFEWTEVALFMMEDKKAQATVSGNLLRDKLVINPEHELLSFIYPVHAKNAKHIKQADQGNYFVTAHRNSAGNVVFTGISPVLAIMLACLEEAPASVEALFAEVQDRLDLEISSEHRQAMLLFFENACDQELIAGFKPV